MLTIDRTTYDLSVEKNKYLSIDLLIYVIIFAFRDITNQFSKLNNFLKPFQ